MKNTKRVIALCLALSMGLSIFACNNLRSRERSRTRRTEDEEETTEKTEKEPTETTEEPTPDITTVQDPDPTTPTPATNTGRLDEIAPPPGCEIPLKPVDQRYHYNMDLELDPDKCTIGGHVEFTFFNDSKDDWEELCLRDYSSLFVSGGIVKSILDGDITQIDNITDSRYDGSLKFMREPGDDSVVWIPLEEALGPGEKMTLCYDFEAKIPELADRYGHYNSVFNVTNFYPILAEYTDDGWSHLGFYNCGECFYSEVSDYEVKIKAPKDFIFLTSGTEVGSEESGSDRVTEFYAPCVRDFVFSASDEFIVETEKYGGVTINVAYNKVTFKGDPEGFVPASFECAEASLDIFGYAFGLYPYEELDIIYAPIDAGGMEYPNLIIINDDYCMDNYCYLSKYDILFNCVCHEIGHQWFMGIVGSNSAGEPWLDESSASYTELVFAQGYSYKLGDMDLSSNSAEDFDLVEYSYLISNSLPLNLPYADYPSESDYISAAYTYGKAFLYQLQEELGQEEFYAFYRTYVNRYAFQNATTDDFLEVFFECFGSDNERANELIAVCLSA